MCGILADKDIDGIVSVLRDSFSKWIVAGLDGDRSIAPEVLAERIERHGVQLAGFERDVGSACERAEAIAGADDIVVVFGSFLTVGPALDWLTG